MLLIKLITFCLIGHTLYVNFTALTEILGPVSASTASDLCELADTGQSWSFNLDYTVITSETCDALPQALSTGKCRVSPSSRPQLVLI